jgi:hypothetical protein
MRHYTPAALRHLLRALALAALPLLAAGGDKVGPETCKACHPGAFAAWAAGPHARARESLREKSRDDRRCLSCHAPDAEDGLAGVSCESCHGAGRLYSAAYVMRDAELARAVGLLDPGEKTCAACHTDSTPSLEAFDFARKRLLIDHWTAERAPEGPKAEPAPKPAAKPPAAPAKKER